MDLSCSGLKNYSRTWDTAYPSRPVALVRFGLKLPPRPGSCEPEMVTTGSFCLLWRREPFFGVRYQSLPSTTAKSAGACRRAEQPEKARYPGIEETERMQKHYADNAARLEFFAFPLIWSELEPSNLERTQRNRYPRSLPLVPDSSGQSE